MKLFKRSNLDALGLALASRIMTFAAALMLAFALADCLGDPLSQFMSQEARADDWARARSELGQTQPIWTRFADFSLRALSGDFGVSYRTHQSVGLMILGAFPATLDLAIASGLTALLIAIPAGVHVSTCPHTLASRGLLGFSVAAGSVPVFVLAILVMTAGSAGLGLLPAFGRGTTMALFEFRGVRWDTGLLTLSGWQSLVMPVLAIVLTQCGLLLRLVQCGMQPVLRQQYILAAHARGLSRARIHYSHALRNASHALVASGSLQFGNMIVFALVTEAVFQRPGLGLLFLQSIESADVPVICAYLLFACLCFAVIDALAGVVLRMADPRTPARPPWARLPQ